MNLSPQNIHVHFHPPPEKFDQAVAFVKSLMADASPSQTVVVSVTDNPAISKEQYQKLLSRAAKLDSQVRAEINKFLKEQDIARLSDLPVSLLAQFEEVLSSLECGVAAKAA